MNRGRTLRSRKEAERRGRFSERLAAWSCRVRGFRVLAERYRTPFGEIDLVLRRRGLLIFAEVKARETFDEALHALRPPQQQRLAQAAAIYLRDHPIHDACAIRFDLIAVRPWRWPRQIGDAWRPESSF
ncbi:MAG: YraN family protein [Alphaproteobacteria bacterium]|nr:YraN family protein [Alphaproteobacteria bacterium]